jgi:ADP-ribose pyrophosphatase YjhB (NUDIX family)
MTEQTQPLVSIDVVPVRFTDTIEVIVGKRIYEPFIGQLALPGVLLLNGESIIEAAHRALLVKTGIEASDVLSLIQVGAFDNPDRDPRGPTISISFVAIIRQGELNPLANIVTEFDDLPFDHPNIIEAALSAVNVRLWSDKHTTRAVLGDEFTTTRAVAVTEAFSTGAVDKTNFNRMLKSYSPIERIEGVTVTSGKGRPPAYWGFVK